MAHEERASPVGFNAEEARSLTDVSEVTAQNFHERLAARWGALPPALLEPYPFETDAEARDARAEFERDLRFGWDIRAWARLAAPGREPVHVYYLAIVHHTRKGQFSRHGAPDVSLSWLMFDHLDQQPWLWTEADRRLVDAMTGYWAAFARDGDPNGSGRPV